MPTPKPPTLDQVCEKALRLPCAPSLLPRLVLALQNEESSSSEIERLISLDTTLAAATLRLANSVVFSTRKVDSLQEAVLRLGVNDIYRLAALVLVNRWETGTNTALRWSPGDFSRHSLCTAIAAEMLAQSTEKVDPQVAYTAGLISDIGKLALAHICGEFYPAVRAHCEKTGSTWEEAERAVMGYNHADVNAQLLQAWKFPPLFLRTAQFLLKPEEAPADVMPLLSHLLAAKYLATAMGPGVTEEGFLVKLPGNFLTEQGFTPELIEETLPLVLEKASAQLGERLSHGAISMS
jgi:HD-like signal output (HDOD) protein